LELSIDRFLDWNRGIAIPGIALRTLRVTSTVLASLIPESDKLARTSSAPATSQPSSLWSWFSCKSADGVIDVTKSNFAKVVYGRDKAVLIIFYDSITEKAEEVSDILLSANRQKNNLFDLLTELSKRYNNEVTFAKSDLAVSDISIEVYHVPTIKLYPSSSKKSLSMEYFGPQDQPDECEKFIKIQTGQDTRSQGSAEVPKVNRGKTFSGKTSSGKTFNEFISLNPAKSFKLPQSFKRSV
jgi:hypothetical protein